MLRILPMPMAQYKIDGKDLFTSGQMQDYAIKCQEAAKVEDLMTAVCKEKEWVGLTDEVISSLCDCVPDYDISTYDLFEFAKAIEAKLKEKNVPQP